jgi:hypothetical protein
MQMSQTFHTHKRSLRNNVKRRGALVDRGANGGIAGDDTRVIHKHLRKVDVTGIDNHEMTDLQIVDMASWAMSNKGPVIVIFNQYAYHGLGCSSIHSAIQLEHYKNRVDDRSIKSRGRQCLTTLEGYVIPLDIINGLPYMKMRPPSDDEIRDLPHIIMTSGERWNPAKHVFTLSDQDNWYNTICKIDEGELKTPFDEYGRYMGREPVTGIDEPPPLDDGEASSSDDDSSVEEDGISKGDVDEDNPDGDEYELAGALHEFYHAFQVVSNLNDISAFPVATRRMREKAKAELQDKEEESEDTETGDFLNEPDDITPTDSDEPKPVTAPSNNTDEPTDQAVAGENTPLQYTSLPETNEKKENYEQYRPYFLHVPVKKICKMFENTTQHATNIVSGPKIHQTIQSPYPAYNVCRRNEPVDTDAIFAEVPAVDTNGMKMCQIFVGRKSLVIDVFGMHNNAEFVNTLEDVIRKWGARDKLISDSAKVEISNRVLDILRAL